MEACPQSEELWLLLAKEKWQTGDIDEARRVLGRAFSQNPNNEDIWLAAVKLEADAQQTDQARELLATARREAGTDRVWVKSVAFERQLGNIDEALDLVNQGLQLYPKADKLWMMKGQIYETQKKYPQAREAYKTGARVCSKSVALWLLASRLEEKAGAVVKARSVLDQARLAVPKSAELWTESVAEVIASPASRSPPRDLDSTLREVEHLRAPLPAFNLAQPLRPPPLARYLIRISFLSSSSSSSSSCLSSPSLPRA